MELHCGHCGSPLGHSWELASRPDAAPTCLGCDEVPVTTLSLAAYAGFAGATVVLCAVCGHGRLAGHRYCHGCGKLGEPAPERDWGLQLDLSAVARKVLDDVPHEVAWWLAGRFLGESPGDWDTADGATAERLFRQWLENLSPGPPQPFVPDGRGSFH